MTLPDCLEKLGEPGKIKRPVLRYFGGKYILAPWIISNFPEHRIYVEPFGGAASVLMRKPRSYAEVYNDLDDSVFLLFQTLRDEEKASALKYALEQTPFSRREMEVAHIPHPDPIEKARRMIVRSFMGFGADSVNSMERATGFRSNSNRSGSTPAHDWANYAQHIPDFTKRLQGVVIENRDAFEVMAQHDGPNTLHYLDPPYWPENRRKRVYKHETDEGFHFRLADFIKGLKGKVVLSGYSNPAYESLKFRRVERTAFADGAKKRTESLWMNF